MGGRYYLTGVQLGMLMSATDGKVMVKIFQEIMDNQFIGNFDNNEFENRLTLLTEQGGECGK